MKSILMLFAVLCSTAVFSQFNEKDADGKRHGKWQARYQNGELFYEVTFDHGLPTGTEKRYDIDGKLKANINHFGDGKTSAAFLYYPSGDIQAMGKYFEKEKDSLWMFFLKDSVKLKQEFYRKGVKHGSWISYYSNGSKLEEKEYENGIQIGEFKQYYSNGEIKLKVKIKNGVWDGLMRNYYPNGNISNQGVYRNAYKEGKWTFFLTDGSVEKTMTFKKGLVVCRSDEALTYYPGEIYKKEMPDDGFNEPAKPELIESEDKKLRSREVFDENCLGTFSEFYPSGKPKRQGFYFEGNKDSTWNYFNTVGVKDSTVNFNSGFRNGEKLFYYSTGKIRLKENWSYNKLHGVKVEYAESGAILKEEEYKNGVLISKP